LIGVWERANDQGAWEMGFEVPDDLANSLKGKAVYIVGADPVGDDPELAKALEEAQFVVVQDVMQTATTEIADVLLPARAFTEREGTLTSGERRVQRFYSAVPPTGDPADYSITSQVAGHMGSSWKTPHRRQSLKTWLALSNRSKV
jgi:NADH-quinone oxidoreductase subunit G